MLYIFKGRAINIDDKLFDDFNTAMQGIDEVDDALIAMYLSTSEYYDESRDNVVEVLDRLIEEGTCDAFINNSIKNDLFLE